MFFHPSRVFPLQWPLSGTTRPAVTCNITLTFIFKVCCSVLLNSHRSARVFACLANRCVLFRILENSLTQIRLQSETLDGSSYREKKQMRLLTLYAKLTPPPPPHSLSFNQTTVAFLTLPYKLECFDKFLKSKVKWRFVLKWGTWRVKAQRSEFFHLPIWKDGPELSCPLRAPQKKGLIIHGWWKSVTVHAQGVHFRKERNLKGSAKTLAVPSHSLAARASACQTRGESNWKDHTKSLKCLFFSAHIRAKPLLLTQPRRRGR